MLVLMHKSVYLFLILITGLHWFSNLYAQPLTFPVDSDTYLWPTDASNQISSTFAETRSAHLHAGLDIRTFGREGYQVFATRDGIVYRIGTGPYGYGNVVYLKHNDGSYSIYAHLNRFEPKLQAYTDSIRFINNNFDLDLIVEDDSISYNQGDVIAFTGSTGIGPPHLHFELRTPDFEPFNPFLTNLYVQDTIAPIFRQLAVEFKNNHTLHPEEFDIFNAQIRNNQYDFGEIEVSGPVGLSVNVHDRANSTPNIYAVYSLMMIHQSDTLFHSRADFFPHQHRRHMFLDRSYQILAQTRRGFQRLFLVNGNQLPFYRKVKNRGILNLSEGTWPIEIIASDIYGNKSKALATLKVNSTDSVITDEIDNIPTYPSIPNRPDEQFQAFYSSVTGQNLIKTEEFASTETVAISSVEKKPIPYRIYPDFSIEKEFISSKKSTISSPDKKLWIDFPKHALYDDLTLRMQMVQSEEGIFINFEPDRLPIQESLTLHYLLPPEWRYKENLALYSVDKFRNRKSYINSTTSDGILRASMREISSLFLTEDNTPPWIGNARVGKDLAGNNLVIFPVRDGNTGIDYKNSEIIVNEITGLTKYDPDKGQLYYYKPGFVPDRVNNVYIKVHDGVGNKSEKTVSFRYSP